MAKSPSRPGTDRLAVAVTVLCLIALLVTGVVAWAFPRPQGDFYLALAGGRDVLDGKLARPDDWSFATDGRVWVHQNWGSDVLFHLAHRAGGEAGVLGFKALAVALLALAVIGAARRRNVLLPTAVLGAAAALASWPEGMTLRGNLLSLILAPTLLAILYRSVDRPAWIWIAALLIGVWSNLHGGFLFGLGMLGLWVLVRLVAAGVQGGAGAAISRSRVPLGALGLAAALAAFANPFGLDNLTVPFLLRTSPVWKTVTEWRPVLAAGPIRSEIPWVFFGLVAAVAGGTARRFLGGSRTRDDGATFWFELLLAAVAASMGFLAARFVLFASVVLAPIAARRLQELAGTRVLPVAAGLAILVAGYNGTHHRWLPEFYDAANPLRPAESVLERMVYHGTHFPPAAATFLDANGVEGRVFHEWRWEGYLRWRCPELQVYMGGRAHQVYDGSVAERRVEILTGADPAGDLAALEVGLCVVPLDAQYSAFVQKLLRSGTHRWAYVFCDRVSAVLVDLDTPLGASLGERLLAGGLHYAAPETAVLSAGMHLASPAVGAAPADAYRTLLQALQIRPAYFAYGMAIERGLAAGVATDDIVGYLESEARRLEGLPVRTADGIEVLDSRKMVGSMLASIYGSLGRGAEQRRAAAGVRAAEAEIERLTWYLR